MSSNPSSGSVSMDMPPSSASCDADAPIAPAQLPADLEIWTINDLRKYKHLIKIRPVLEKNKFEGQYCKLYIDDGTTKGRTLIIQFKAYSQFGLSCYEAEDDGKGGAKKQSWTCAFPLFDKEKQPRMDELTGLPLSEIPTILDEVAKREIGLHGSKMCNDPKTNVGQWHDRLLSTAKNPQDTTKAEQFGPSLRINVNPDKIFLNIQTSDTTHRQVTKDEMNQSGRGTMLCRSYCSRIFFGARYKTYGVSLTGKSLYKYKYDKKSSEQYDTQPESATPASSSSSSSSSSSPPAPATTCPPGASEMSSSSSPASSSSSMTTPGRGTKRSAPAPSDEDDDGCEDTVAMPAAKKSRH